MHGSPPPGNTPESIKELIDLLGGARVVAEVCGVNRTQVWRWTAAKKRSAGLGGKIPRRHWKHLREYANAVGVIVPNALLAPELAE